MTIAGLGFRATATVEALQDALAASGYANDIDALATAKDKADSPVLIAFAGQLGISIHAIEHACLTEQKTPTQSTRVQSRYGTGSLAEAAALAAIGKDAQLVQSRVISSDGTATVAIAQGQNT